MRPVSRKNYDLAVCIGRFQPIHNGHVQMIKRASLIADDVMVIIGSAGKARDIKNPFTARERRDMIDNSMRDVGVHVTTFDTITDSLYSNAQWAKRVQESVYSNNPHAVKICIVGHKKDESSFYIDMFPQWEFIEMGPMFDGQGTYYNSTDIRNQLFDGKTYPYPGLVPPAAWETIKKMDSEEFSRLREEWTYFKAYKESWARAPYAPTFVTSDAVVEKSGHVLLVERGAAPGKGLLALPGGFVNQFESIEDACIRELREETKLKVPEAVLRGSIKSREVFDNPFRSLRGRTITHAFHIKLQDGALDKVKGSDDAKDAMWVPFNELKSEMMFEDHYDIILKMTGI